jgi:hypothetical protein
MFKNRSAASLASSHANGLHDSIDVFRGSLDSHCNLATVLFPDLTFHDSLIPSVYSYLDPQSNHTSHQHQWSSSLFSDILTSWASLGPFLSRLVATSAIAAPMFTITLQRDTIDIGGNSGLLSIGELPPGMSNDSLTWTHVRRYPAAQGGLSTPSDLPFEVRFLTPCVVNARLIPRRYTPSLGRYF